MNITRFAPSPTGRLHLGHAFSAVLGQNRARESGGRFLVRIEDLDQTRSKSEFVDAIFDDLRWLGLEWAPPLLIQSQRTSAYQAALQGLRAAGLVYACFCTRSDMGSALEAPHGNAVMRYPGSCRELPDDAGRRAKQPHSWRLDAGKALERTGLPSWIEEGRRWTATPDQFDDVILARKDAPAAYHLACVVDDAASGVDLIVRGADLRPSTPIQRLLQLLHGMPEPSYLHHSLVAHSDGRRLAKRDRAPTLHAMREAGVDGRALAADLGAGKLPLGFTFLEA